MLDREVSIAFVHHANQFLITDGYENRDGVSTIAGRSGTGTGLRRVLELHRRYRVPLNLHISGTLLEALAWHCPDFLGELRELAELQLVEFVGSSYGQNMMRFFSHDHNRRQLREQLLLYDRLLAVEPERIAVFWVPERLWDTDALAPVLTDPTLSNGGYRYVVIDDRLLHPASGRPSPRHLYDQRQTWDPAHFSMYDIHSGGGLRAIPIANNLRQNIPPRRTENLDKVMTQLGWLLDINPDCGNAFIAVYADDMEKAAGVGWDARGPAQFEGLLRSIVECPWVRPVKLSDWASTHSTAGKRRFETGAYVELVKEFDAGETYERWYDDPRWAPYRVYALWTEKRVRDLEAQGADSDLMELAWKTLLATAWQTAWHTPRTGAHGHPTTEGGPSAWVRAIASHSRLAAIIAEAAHWVKHKERRAQARVADLDHDGRTELIMRNDSFFAVFTPEHGGRLVYLFTTHETGGCVAVGNPIDDWNLLEELHAYMDVPPNHPGAFSDVGYEHDVFQATVDTPHGATARATLRNVAEGSPAYGLEKRITLAQESNEVRLDYVLPKTLVHLSTEIGVSPDYLNLLRAGSRGIAPLPRAHDFRGWQNNGLAVWLRLAGPTTFWDAPRQVSFGHGYLTRVTSRASTFTVWIGAASQ